MKSTACRISVIMTSLVFSLFHGSLLTIPSLFVAGVFYAVLTHLFKSVYPAIICHCINNGLAVYISLNRDFVSYLLGDVIFVIILIIVLFAVLYLTLRLTENVIDDLGDKKRLKTNRRALVYGDRSRQYLYGCFLRLALRRQYLKLLISIYRDYNVNISVIYIKKVFANFSAKTFLVNKIILTPPSFEIPGQNSCWRLVMP